MLELYKAVIEVPRHGYAWVDAGAFDIPAKRDEEGRMTLRLKKYGRYLELAGPKNYEQVRRYEPLVEHSGLFRTFAELEPAEDAILAFANKYGWLEKWVPMAHESEAPTRVSELEYVEWANTPPRWGESLDRWRTEIESIREAVNLWDELTGFYRDTETVDLPPLKPRQEAITEWQRLGYITNVGLQRLGTTNLGWDGTRLAFRFQFAATGLREVLWIQLARALVGEKKYGRCKSCLAYFEVGPRAGRKGKIYCSDACRSAAYRERKEQKT